MISCTEFIPAYSEFFKYIDQKSGRQAVYDFWDALFQPGNSPLDGLIAKHGRLRGSWENWYVVYTEEACDNTMLYNEEEGWMIGCMHHCPSKGRFQKLGYMEPFEEYCKHCDGYDIVFKKQGVCHVMDYRGNECAKCREVMFDPDKFKGDPQKIHGQSHRFSMEVSSGNHRSIFRKQQRIIRYRIQFNIDLFSNIVDRIPAGAVYLRNTAQRIGILHSQTLRRIADFTVFRQS